MYIYMYYRNRYEIVRYNHHLQMHNTVVYGNSANQRGTIYVHTYSYVRYRTLLLNVQVELRNITTHINRAGQGGVIGVYNDHHYDYYYGNLTQQLVIRNTTVYSNRASNQGGVLYIYSNNRQGTSNVHIEIQNTIIYSNNANQGGAIYINSDGSYNGDSFQLKYTLQLLKRHFSTQVLLILCKLCESSISRISFYHAIDYTIMHEMLEHINRIA